MAQPRLTFSLCLFLSWFFLMLVMVQLGQRVDDITCIKLAEPPHADLRHFMESDPSARAREILQQLARDPLVQHGGFYSPASCSRRVVSRVLILVPFRDRIQNLEVFLAYMHPFLQAQDLEYRIVFISQSFDGRLFNRGSLLNVGFVLATATAEWDCVVLHDVDLLPESLAARYHCSDKGPLEMNVADSLHNFSMVYPKYFGGVSALTPGQFRSANGFSNTFFGWGGEDDDLRARIVAAGMQVDMANPRNFRYWALPHERQPLSVSNRFAKLKSAKKRFISDGLNSVAFRLVAREFHRLYTNLTVELLPPSVGTHGSDHPEDVHLDVGA